MGGWVGGGMLVFFCLDDLIGDGSAAAGQPRAWTSTTTWEEGGG